jgi:hypothetical protein
VLKKIGFFYTLAPIFMGIFGFVFFVIFAAAYNALAKWLGGVEVEVKNVDRPARHNRSPANGSGLSPGER